MTLLSRCRRTVGPWLAGTLLAAAGTAGAAPLNDLTALSLEQLLDTTVVGASKYAQKQSEVAAAVSVITRDEIKAHGWRTLADALSSLPGVYTTYDRQYTYLGARGFGLPGDLTARLLITINGNRVNDPVYDGGPAGREFPLAMGLVERIEFIPGPGGAVYGQNAMFGVVNIITRSGADLDGTELSIAHQPTQRQSEARLSWGKRLANGTDVLLSATTLRAAGADRHFDFGASGLSGVAAGMDGERLQQFFAQVARGAWSAELVQGLRRKDDPVASYLSDPLLPGQFARDGYTLANLQYNQRFAGDTLQIWGRLFAGRYRYAGQNFYAGALTSFPAAGDWRGTEWRLMSTAWSGHKLMLGLEAQNNLRTNISALDLADPANDVHVRASSSRIGLYLQDEWQIGPSLIATLGARLDRNAASGTSSSPRAALIWRAAAGTTLKGLYGRAHRSPNVNERDYADDYAQTRNPSLPGESIDTLELVADTRLGPELGLRGALYQWTMRDIITLGMDTVSGLAQFQSGSLVKARGLELSADQVFASGARVRGSVSRQQVSREDGGALPNSPRWLARMNLSTPMPWAGWRAGLEWRFDARRQTLDGSALGGFAITNLQLRTAALAPGLELSVGIQNLFDKRYAHPGADTNWQNALQQDGRNLRLQLDLRF